MGQKGGHAYIWAPVGSRPLMVRDNRHVSTYIFGAICPDRAVGSAMIMPYANTEAMNVHLKEISAEVDGERLGVSAPEHPLRPRLGNLRPDPRRLPERLALPHQRS